MGQRTFKWWSVKIRTSWANAHSKGSFDKNGTVYRRRLGRRRMQLNNETYCMFTWKSWQTKIVARPIAEQRKCEFKSSARPDPWWHRPTRCSGSAPRCNSQLSKLEWLLIGVGSAKVVKRSVESHSSGLALIYLWQRPQVRIADVIGVCGDIL